MRIIAFSDTHLTKQLDKRKLKFLLSIIESSNKVIINGDLFDLYRSKFFKIIQTWEVLFKLLSTKQTVLTLGNHDNFTKEHKKYLLEKFKIQVVPLTSIPFQNQELVFMHGHVQSPTLDMINPRFFTNKIVISLHNFRNVLLVKLFGERYFSFKSKENLILMKYALESLTDNQVLVCGHTHVPEFDLEHKFINLGFVDYGIATYLEIVDNRINLVKQRY